MSKTIIKAFAISSIAFIGASAIADAHPILESTVPAAAKAGSPSALQDAPKEIRLKFSEDVMAKFSGLDLKDEEGRKVATGAPATDPSDRTLLVVPLAGPMGPGRYTVTWHAVSEDTHRVKGAYSFTIQH